MAATLNKTKEAPGQVPDWLRLQKKIFGRWVNQKVRGVHAPIDDVVKDMSSGVLLVNLLESLSEKKFTGKQDKNAKMRLQKIDNVNMALKFVWDCGVIMKLKPSAEDLVDENDKLVLGLIWAIMSKYMKIGDEDESQQLNAKDALLMWVQNKVAGYKDVKVENFGSSWHDGLALCALIHKHRPKLINFEKLNKDNKKDNLTIAIDAAEKFFNLEKYLTAEDIPKLDENSMVVYVSEYYYGIYEQRKLDLAAKRIGKVIKLTKENDALKIKFDAQSKQLRGRLDAVEKILADRVIDNTMASAKRKIEEFYEYKSKEKNVIIGEQLDLEALYNNLAMRLSHNKRPEYVPKSGLSLKDIEKSFLHLEECEQERKVALHAELNRQIKLVKLDEQHKSRFEKLQSWIAQKEEYLKTQEIIDSVSGAQLQLRLLDAYDKESGAVFEGGVQGQLKKFGVELTTEKYEKIQDIKTRETEIDAQFVNLGKLSQAKRPVLEDALARETFKQKVRLMNQAHVDSNNKLHAWIGDKENYLKTREQINSVSESRTQLSLLDSYEEDKKGMSSSSVAQLKQLGAEILAQKYETKYSRYTFEHPEEIHSRESSVDQKWVTLTELSTEKRKILDDHLARELFKEKVLTMNQQHVDKFNQLHSWIAEKENYLKTREVIASVTEARTQLSLLESYENDKVGMGNSNVTSLKHLGAEILAAKYETQYSKYAFETPSEISTRESTVDKKWVTLTELSTEKKKVLEDHLAREEFKEKVLLMNQQHVDKYNKLQSWIGEKENYLKTREVISSVSESRTQLSLLDSYEKDKESTANSNVAQLKQLGKDILASKYQTNYSSYHFENPKEIQTREGEVDQKWKLLTELSDEKRKVLNDHLAREEFKEKVRMMNHNHVDKSNQLQAWIAEKETYLKTKENIQSVADAQTQLSLLESYEKEKVRTSSGNVAQLKQLGTDIIAQKYKTNYSEYHFETPEEIKTRESAIDEKWNHLSALSAEKKKVLDADLAREVEKERLRLEFAHLASEFTRWVKDNAENLAVSQFGYTLEEVEAYQAVLNSSNSALDEEANSRKSESEAVHKKMTEMGVTQNIYTKLTLNDLAKSRSDLSGAVDKRKSAYNADLARQRANDTLCKDFANISEPFSKWIAEQKEVVTSSSAEIEAQLVNVKGRVACFDKDSKLPQINSANAKMEAAGITNNRHTTLTAKDVEVQWQQYHAFLERKISMLEEEIAIQKLRGITVEQFKEIQDNFKQFDADNSGSIDKKELKACLYSLGEEKSNSEVDAIIVKYGTSGAIKYDGFKEFMISTLGVTDTKDDILTSFKLINRGEETANFERMELVMADEDLGYFTESAEKCGSGYEYKKWTESMFAR